VVAVDNEDHRIEVGVIGYEGVTGVPLIMGDSRAQHSTYMQIPGSGHRIGAAGSFFRPTLLAEPAPDAQALRTEPFGPLALATRFGSIEDALKQANSTPFGLAAYAFTQSAATAVTVSEELQAGGIGINTFAVSHIEAPFGGLKDSGYGHEGGPEGLESYVHAKYVHHA
ncbi:MAG: aldehyde dehydrogenase family protein, partial [Pseudomonadota bacterium]